MYEIVPGSGPERGARVAFIGEAPGDSEARQGKGFVGRSGTLLWLWAWQYAHLNRDEVWVTNLVKEYTTGNPDPTSEQIAEWGPQLVDELRGVGATVLVTLGRFSSRYLTGKPYSMEVLNGRAWPTLPAHGLSTGTVAFPIVHPAAGLHRDSLLQYTSEGLRALGRVLEAKAPPVVSGNGWLGRERYHQVRTLPKAPWPNLYPLPIDTEGHPIWSIQVSTAPGTGYLLDASDRKLVRAFRKKLERERPCLLFHNAQWDLKRLRDVGIDVLEMGLDFRDTLIYARNLKVEPGGLKALARRHLGMPMAEYSKVVGPVEEAFALRYLTRATRLEWEKEGRKHTPGKRVASAIKRYQAKGDSLVEWWRDKDNEARPRIESRLGGPMPKPGFKDMPRARFIRYACRDADATGQLRYPLLSAADELGLLEVVGLEHRALPLVDRMEQIGMRVDVAACRLLSAKLQDIMQDAKAICEILTGIEGFNPKSPDQVGDWCRGQWAEFGRCGITKMTPGGKTSTDDDALKAIRLDHPAIEAILEYRQAEKLKNSYADPLPTLLDPDDVYRPKFGYTKEDEGLEGAGRTQTGRLRERILTIPVRTEHGRAIRRLFHPALDGYCFVSVDYSQIELRLAAELSGDEEMLKAFQEGKDFHSDTACKMLGITESQLTEDKRFPFKTANFALIYLASAKTLLEKFKAEGIRGYDLDATEELRKDWFKLYRRIPGYYKKQVAYAKQHGLVRSKSGRIRYLPGIYCDEWGLRGWPYNYLYERAVKIAGNHPIQGGVADLVLDAMARLWDQVVKPKVLGIEPALQIHDDIMMQAPKANAQATGKLVREVMLAKQSEYRVPIEAKVKVGETWGEMR